MHQCLLKSRNLLSAPALLSGDRGGNSLSLILPSPSPFLVAPPPELAPWRYLRGLAMRAAAGLSFPSCGVAASGGESSAGLAMEAGRQRMGGVGGSGGRLVGGSWIWRWRQRGSWWSAWEAGWPWRLPPYPSPLLVV
jgi:hypothetical protein